MGKSTFHIFSLPFFFIKLRKGYGRHLSSRAGARSQEEGHTSDTVRNATGSRVSLLLLLLLLRLLHGLTVVDEDVRATTRPLVRLSRGPPDVVGARQVDGDEVQVLRGQLLRLEDGHEQVELRAAPRQDHHGASRLKLWCRAEETREEVGEQKGLGKRKTWDLGLAWPRETSIARNLRGYDITPLLYEDSCFWRLLLGNMISYRRPRKSLSTHWRSSR